MSTIFREYLDKDQTLYRHTDGNIYQTVFQGSGTDDIYEEAVLKAIGSDCKVLRLATYNPESSYHLCVNGVDLDEVNENVREIVLENRSDFIGKNNTLPSNFIKDPAKLPKLKEIRAITRNWRGECLTNVWIAGWDDRVVSYPILYNGMLFVTLSNDKDSVATLGGLSYRGAYNVEGDLRLPEKILDGSKEYTLKEISFYSFRETDIKSLFIPSSVKRIGEGAFRFCFDLNKVTLSNGLEEIGDYAFCECGLEELYIPDTLVSIGENAFLGCPLKHLRLGASLKKIREVKSHIVTIPANYKPNLLEVLSCIDTAEYKIEENCDSLRVEDGVLYDKDMKKLLAYPVLKEDETFTLPSSVTTIADDAFGPYSSFSLKEIRIPKSVRKIPPRLKESEWVKITRI